MKDKIYNIENYKNLYHPYNHMDLYSNVKSVLKYSNKEEKQSNKVKISFVIPTYKRTDLLKEAIESIMHLDNLEKHSYEIIIVDNSADLSEYNESLCMVKELKCKNTKYYVNEKNIGWGNWNRCVQMASGKYISMLHDDDLLEHQYIDVMDKTLLYLEKQNINLGGITVSRSRFKDKSDMIQYNKYDKSELNTNTLLNSLFDGIGPTSCPTCGMIFSKKAFYDVGGFYEEYGVTCDYILGYMMLKKGYNYYTTVNRLGYYRVQENCSTKLETNLSFIKGDYYFREFMYSESVFRRIFGAIFRRVQYTNSLKSLTRNAEDFGLNVTVRDMAFKNDYGRCPIRSFIFKVIRKLYSIMNRHNKIVITLN